MFKYRYIHDVPVAFSELHIVPENGVEIEVEFPISHPYWELIVPAVIPQETTEEVAETESPVAADLPKE